MFFAPIKDKTTLFTMFSFSRNPKIESKQRYFRCFCNGEKGVFGECRKTQINIRMAKIQECCILRCFFPFRCENFCFEKRSKHRNLQCFLLPPKTKQRYLRCFPSLAAPKYKPSLCKYHLDTADAKRPKHHLDASQKTVSRYLWNPHIREYLEPQSTSPAYANKGLCKHHLDTADAKRPKHHLDTSRKPPKTQAKKLFHVTFKIHIKQSLEPQSTCPA